MALALYTETLNLDTIAWTPVRVPIAMGGGAANGVKIYNIDTLNSVRRRTNKDDPNTEVLIDNLGEEMLPPVFPVSRLPTGLVIAHLQAVAGAPVVKLTWF